MTEKRKDVDLESMSEEELKEYVDKNLWKVRTCDDYLSEFMECKSIKMKFHNWFINGELGSCTEWKEDYKNCHKSVENYKAMASIIKHENERLEKRLNNHLANDIWEKRDSPPSNWNSELPDFLKEKQINSFVFEAKQKNSCVIF